MIKFEDLKDGMIIALTSDVENEWNTDRRVSRDWRCRPQINSGFKLMIRRNDEEHNGKKWHWFEMVPRGGGYPEYQRLPIHAKPHSKDDDLWFLTNAILKSCETAKITRHDRFAQMGLSDGGLANVLEVLLETGAITFADVEGASKKHICERCDKLATKCDGLQHSYMCDEHNTDPNAEIL